MASYEKIQSLIGLWSEFEQMHNSSDVREFGKWLCCQPSEKTGASEVVSHALPEENNPGARMLSDETSEHLTFYKEMPESRQFLTLLSRSARFIDFYIKKAFESLPINSRLEFQFLITIKEMRNPRKTDVIYFNLVEISTGVETLNRLQKHDLIHDFPDEQDRRIKRLSLTPKGNELLDKALEKFDVLDNLTRNFGVDDSWKNFIPSLMWFNDYHNQIYHQHRNLSFDELMTVTGLSTNR